LYWTFDDNPRILALVGERWHCRSVVVDTTGVGGGLAVQALPLGAVRTATGRRRSAPDL